MESLRGQLLIAASSLLDQNFARTVVLIALHGEEGALGLVLNHEMNLPVRQVWKQINEGVPCLREQNARQGGPVGGSLLVLHDQPSLANIVVGEDIYLATELSDMERLVNTTEGRAHFYIGHSGWGAGQLERELTEGTWHLLPAHANHVYGQNESLALWQESMLEVGRRQIRTVAPIRHFPSDPRLN